MASMKIAKLQLSTFLSLSLILTCAIGNPVNELNPAIEPKGAVEEVKYFEQIGGSILENPFPVPTIVRSIRLEQVQISDQLLAEMLANCLQVEGFHFKPYDDNGHARYLANAKSVDEYKFDLALVTQMQGHHFTHFILDAVAVNFNAPSPIYADLLVTFFESTLTPDFTAGLTTQIPDVNTLNLVGIDIAGVGHGVRATDLEYLLSGAIPSLRHMFIRDFNWSEDGGTRLRSIFAQLGCPGVQGHVFLDKDFDHWEC